MCAQVSCVPSLQHRDEVQLTVGRTGHGSLECVCGVRCVEGGWRICRWVCSLRISATSLAVDQRAEIAPRRTIEADEWVRVQTRGYEFRLAGVADRNSTKSMMTQST